MLNGLAGKLIGYAWGTSATDYEATTTTIMTRDRAEVEDGDFDEWVLLEDGK